MRVTNNNPVLLKAGFQRLRLASAILLITVSPAWASEGLIDLGLLGESGNRTK